MVIVIPVYEYHWMNCTESRFEPPKERDQSFLFIFEFCHFL